MLVLSRKKDERIIIGDNIAICVVEIRGDKVRLGIEAPQEISVHRQEVYDAIHAEERAHLETPPNPRTADGPGVAEEGPLDVPGPADA